MNVTRPPERLKNSREFRRVYELGRRYHTPFFNAFLLRTNSPEPRFGFTVTKKIGNAVVRNRCKRRLREMVRRYFQKARLENLAVGGFDLVLNAKSTLPAAEFRQMEEAFERMMKTILAGSPEERES